MAVVFVFVAAAVLGLLAGVHRYLWRRLVRDTTAAGGWGRRAGTAAAFVLPLTTVGALVGGRAGAPFLLERILAWPGYLWLALVLYLTLALLVGEAVRPLLHRRFAAKEARAGQRHGGPGHTRPGRRPADGASAALTDTPGEPSAGQAVTAGPGSVPHEASGETSATGRSATGGPAPVAATATVEGGTATVEGGTGTAGGGTAMEPLASSEAPAAAVAVESDAPEATAPELPAPEPAAAPSSEAPLSRRLFVARTVAVAASAAAAGTVGYGAYDVLDGPALKRVTVPLAKLPRAAHGYRIAVVSDIHLGPILGRAHTRRIVNAINSTQPDLVAIVGDLVDGSVADLGPAAEPLARLRSRHGSFFVTGNHEYFSGAAAWVEHIRELGVHPLENARVELPGFDLAGVNDISAANQDPAQGPDYERALGDRDTTRASVLLAHQPVVIHDAVKHGVDLQLSGHTHGGQLWPGNYLAALANPTVAGLERYGDTQLYVTRGAGAWGPPVRVGAQSDITVVTLASPQA
ncbi:metallophosphoesterase [Streptomyces sp. 8N706]|uniref:metallophosphoesterase n=1 Tax=Streptomyces sp. 8N706 TaxID=3457416 RepID=UPI003FCF5BB0